MVYQIYNYKKTKKLKYLLITMRLVLDEVGPSEINDSTY